MEQQWLLPTIRYLLQKLCMLTPSDTTSETIQCRELPIELLEFIYGKLTSTSDYVRFRSVCRSWRAAAPLKNLLPQHPLLMLPKRYAASTCRFHSPWCSKVYSVNVPETRNKFITGCSHGWLILYCPTRPGSISLLNPITRVLIKLPPPMIGVIPYRVSLSSSASTATKDCVVMAIFLQGMVSKIAFCRLGDAAWTTFDTPYSHPPSVCFHKGQFYVLDRDGNITVLNGCSPSAEPIAIPSYDLPLLYVCICLLSTPTDLFLTAYELFSMRCHVFKLDLRGQERRWLKIETMGDDSVETEYVGHYKSCGCVKKDDRFYFARGFEDYYDIAWFESNGGSRRVKYPWEKSMKDMGIMNNLEGSWFTPSLY